MSIRFEPLKSQSVEKYLKEKKLKLSYDYDELLYEAHHRSFTVAKVTKLDLLKDLQDAVTQAINDGVSFETFRDKLKPILQKKGWWGLQEITNPTTGEVKEVYIGSRRLKNILATNRQVAYTQGRYKQQAGFKRAVYFRYNALHYGNRREDHQKKDNIILHKDHTWWETNYPPNGWGCKCYVTAHTKKELERKGWKVYEGKLENIADKDWAYHVGKTDNTTKVYKEKIEALGKPCKEDNAKGKKPCHKKLYDVAAKQYTKDTKTLKERLATYIAVKELFNKDVKNKKVELCESDIFGKNKKVYISSDTVQSHIYHPEINAFHYYLIPLMIEGQKLVFKQKENTYIIIKKFGHNYRLALKNVKNKDEIYVVSLVYVSDVEKEIKKLSKYQKVEE